jgi:predicted nucleotidyltransferase
MRTVGIIVEYNPLHNGHVYHYQQSRIVSDADAVVAVMSGSFLQRGEPALVNKWSRAEMALAMGADLVIELPVAFSAQPAEWFAYGAVSALDATGIVDAFCFGSESGDIQALHEIARRMHVEEEAFGSELQKQLKQGVSYPKAYSLAVRDYLGATGSLGLTYSEEELAKPNNTLGLHYLMALERLGSHMKPLTIHRIKAEYSQTSITDQAIASATAIRKLLLEDRRLEAAKPYVPQFTYRILQREWNEGRAPIHWERFAAPLLHSLVQMSAEELSSFAEVTEGLEHRIKRVLSKMSFQGTERIEQLLTLLKTKRYTRTKLQRTLLRILLHHRKEYVHRDVLAQGVPYLRILGYSRKGRELLRRMKHTAKVPVVTKVTRCDSPLLDMDIRATAVYSLAYQTPEASLLFSDYYRAPIAYEEESEN